MEKLKDVLAKLIIFNHTDDVRNQCTSESGRLVSDVIQIFEILDIPGYLLTMDIEKAFDNLDHDFLFMVSKKFGFGENLIQWIKILLNDQQLYLINGEVKTSHFNIMKGARDGDSTWAYLFILALELLFELIKNNADIRGITSFNHLIVG